ncbi:MAG: beta-ketoacyl synthase N-terminal-like domain-containing protein [Thermodesulfovibrionales bacterium]|nr:beta-ketoacyl synthase N-terminal-like domain-containing protein [Thermodesulfovibrionales bacterium]
MRRVVITGIGAVTPAGNTFAESWESLKAGKSGIGPLEGIEVRGPWRTAGLLKGFDAGAYLGPKEMKRLDPFVHYSVASALMAVEDAGLKEIKKGGVVIGSGRGGITTIERSLNSRRASAYLMPATTISMASSYAAKKAGVKGHCLGISNSCASGANAVGEAARMIKHGVADVMLAGGAEAPVCRLSIEGYGAAGALSKSGVMRPFDRKRDGFVLAEGACVLVLEDYAFALRRGARIYAELSGYGNTADALHETRPDSRTQAEAIMAAVEEAGLGKEEVDYINAHATGTQAGDRSEAEAIKLFAEKRIPVGGQKSVTGHMLAASGAFEAASTVMSIHTGIIPAIANLTEPDFDLDFVTSLRACEISAAVSVSFGFGGVNAALAFKKAS